jgi:D-glycero-D-manno-heptose 1,7-bisphosphate phosphatase
VTTEKKARGTVILDRDGTILVERHYLSDPEHVELLAGVADGLRLLAQRGYRLVVVTNQSGVGRGYFDMDRLAEIHARMRDRLAADGVYLDGIYVCPHTPDECCRCRKPAPALVEAAAADLSFTAADAWVVGDKPCDIELGRAVAARSILVRSGYGALHEAAGDARPDFVANDVLAASEIILTFDRSSVI